MCMTRISSLPLIKHVVQKLRRLTHRDPVRSRPDMSTALICPMSGMVGNTTRLIAYIGAALQVCSRSLALFLLTTSLTSKSAEHSSSSRPHFSILTQWSCWRYTKRFCNFWPRTLEFWDVGLFGGASSSTIAGTASGVGSGNHWRHWASFSVPYPRGSACRCQRSQSSQINFDAAPLARCSSLGNYNSSRR